jgi:hypothetical protein
LGAADARLNLKQLNSVVRKVTEGINVGVDGGKIDMEKALSDALAGMDEALLKVPEANKVADWPRRSRTRQDGREWH